MAGCRRMLTFVHPLASAASPSPTSVLSSLQTYAAKTGGLCLRRPNGDQAARKHKQNCRIQPHIPPTGLPTAQPPSPHNTPHLIPNSSTPTQDPALSRKGQRIFLSVPTPMQSGDGTYMCIDLIPQGTA